MLAFHLMFTFSLLKKRKWKKKEYECLLKRKKEGRVCGRCAHVSEMSTRNKGSIQSNNTKDVFIPHLLTFVV
jgi:hypothetical protein